MTALPRVISRCKRRVGALVYIVALTALSRLHNIRPGKLLRFSSNDGQPVVFIDSNKQTVLADSALVLSTRTDLNGLDNWPGPDIVVRLLVVDRVVEADASRLVELLLESD
jgi:hypothetical protein